MGPVLLLISVVFVAVGTWKWLGIAKAKEPAGPGRTILWAGMTLTGIVLFLLLKLISEWA